MSIDTFKHVSCYLWSPLTLPLDHAQHWFIEAPMASEALSGNGAQSSVIYFTVHLIACQSQKEENWTLLLLSKLWHVRNNVEGWHSNKKVWHIPSFGLASVSLKHLNIDPTLRNRWNPASLRPPPTRSLSSNHICKDRNGESPAAPL